MSKASGSDPQLSPALQAVLFDVDGTLVDTVDLHAQAWSDAFQRFGLNVRAEEVRGQIGKGGDQLIPVFLDRQQIEKFGKDLEKTRGEIFKNQYLPLARAFPSVRELFHLIKSRGLKIGLASSCKQDELAHYLDLADVADLISAATTADDVARSKPHPDVFLSILDKLGAVDPARAMAVGDSPYDAEAAGKARLRTIGLLCGGFSADLLEGAGCIELYDNPLHLLEAFEYSPLSM